MIAIKFLLSTVLLVLTMAFMLGCSSTELAGAQLEKCETFASNQEKIDCRLRNKKALDEFDKENQRDPMSRPRTRRSV